MSSKKDLLPDRAPALLRVPGMMLSAAMLILLVMIGLAYLDWKQYTSARATGFRVLDIQNSLEALESDLLEAETGQRGFLLTGAVRYLEPYTRAIQIVPAELSKLDKLLRSPTGEADSNVSRLNTVVNEKTRGSSRNRRSRKETGHRAGHGYCPQTAERRRWTKFGRSASAFGSRSHPI